MYSYRSSIETGLIVGIQSGIVVTDADIDASIQAVRDVDIDKGAGQKKGIVFVHIVSSESQRPNSTARRKIAKARTEIQSTVYFAMVTSSALIRGVTTAINWAIPPPPRFISSAHPSFNKAVSWAEEKRGEKLSVLYRLFDEAQLALRVGSNR